MTITTAAPTSTAAERHLRAMYRWLELYNQDVHAMIDECYAEQFAVIVPGVLTIADKEVFHGFESQVLEVAPDRVCELDRFVPTDDGVVVQAILRGTDRVTGEPWSTHWCAILAFDADGRIVTDHTYLDPAGWPSV